MRLAFYQAKGGFINRAIRWRTNGPFSHVELVFSDGVSFSAHAKEGVRFTSLINWAPGDWFYVAIPARYPEAAVRKWCSLQTGKRYGYWEIMRFLIPFLPPVAGEKFCSQVCTNALKHAGLWKDVDPVDVGPSELALMALQLTP